MQKLPKFRTEKEEANFWDTHEALDYVDTSQPPPDFELTPELRESIQDRAEKKQRVTLYLEKQQIQNAKIIAGRKSVPYQALMRTWIQEKIEENRKGP